MNKATGNRLKRRKTRKCLDELRKKSRQCSSASKEIANNIGDGSRNRCTIVPHGTNVTKNRLTMKLGMFSKSVRSDTITRPHLSEEFQARMDGNLYKIIDLANGKPSHTVTSGAYEQLVRNNGVRMHEPADGTQSPNESNKSPNALKIETASPQDSLEKCSPPCFTPPNRVNLSPHPKVGREVFSKDQVICIDSSSSESKASSADDDLYQYFKEFMDEVPAHLNSQLPTLMRDDTYESTKEYLQRLNARSCRQETEDNVMGCINSAGLNRTNKKSIIEKTMEQSILLNPLEYIKQYGHHAGSPKIVEDHAGTSFYGNGLAQRRVSSNSFGRYNRSPNSVVVGNLTATGESRATFTFFSSPEEKASATAESSDSSMRISAENHCVASLIEGSPEIRFYPRKLNP